MLAQSNILITRCASWWIFPFYQGIEKVIFREDGQRICINKEKYFESVTPRVWNYHIGGYIENKCLYFNS